VILLFREYSFIVIAVVLAIAAGLVLLTNKPKLNDYLAFGVIVTGLVTAWTILHPRQRRLWTTLKRFGQ
jgi:hypothetical protein